MDFFSSKVQDMADHLSSVTEVDGLVSDRVEYSDRPAMAKCHCLAIGLATAGHVYRPICRSGKRNWDWRRRRIRTDRAWIRPLISGGACRDNVGVNGAAATITNATLRHWRSSE